MKSIMAQWKLQCVIVQENMKMSTVENWSDAKHSTHTMFSLPSFVSIGNTFYTTRRRPVSNSIYSEPVICGKSEIPIGTILAFLFDGLDALGLDRF
jgi:hypothetical protein